MSVRRRRHQREEIMQRGGGVKAEKQRHQEPRHVHPEDEDEQRHERHPAEFASALGEDHAENGAPAQRFAAFAPPADFVEADRRERAEQREPGRQRIVEIAPSERRREQDDGRSAEGINAAEKQAELRCGLEVAQAIRQRFDDVADLDRSHGRVRPRQPNDLAGHSKMVGHGLPPRSDCGVAVAIAQPRSGRWRPI